MITPKFRCSQTSAFVVVAIEVLAATKLSNAQFDICDNQFTFYCSPLYLRLTLSGRLTEGKGERAVFDVDHNLLTVYLPKLEEGVEFEQLEFPNVLLATGRQRHRMVVEKGGDASSSDSELETEFVQNSEETAQSVAGRVYYGFNDDFSCFFGRLGRDASDGVIDLRAPDETSEVERRRQRIADEQQRFVESDVYSALLDEDGEVAAALKFTPLYLVQFENALKADGVRWLVDKDEATSEAFSSHTETAYRLPIEVEEESVPYVPYEKDPKEFPVWEGNVGSFEVPPGAASEEEAHQEVHEQIEAPQATEMQRPNPSLMHRRLACPIRKPFLQFTSEESSLLERLPAPTGKSLVVVEARGWSLLVDLLCCYAFEQYATQGEGNSETVWTLTKLSPSLSWLDVHDSVREACVAFVRRVLVFPLHRSFPLAMRCLRDVGIILLSGVRQVLRALLYVKHALDHSECKFCLSTLYLNPLIGWLQEWCSGTLGHSRIDRALEDAAAQVHQAVVGGSMTSSSQGGTLNAAALATIVSPPLTLFSVDLPFSIEDES